MRRPILRSKPSDETSHIKVETQWTHNQYSVVFPLDHVNRGGELTKPGALSLDHVKPRGERMMIERKSVCLHIHVLMHKLLPHENTTKR